MRRGRLRLAGYVTTNDGVAGTPCTIDATLTDGVVSRTVYGDGTGPIDAFVDGLQRAFGIDVHVRDYHEHALRAGEDAAAVAYVEVVDRRRDRLGRRHRPEHRDRVAGGDRQRRRPHASTDRSQTGTVQGDPA